MTTSGPGTGQAPTVDKIRRMKEALGPQTPLAIASGISSSNVEAFLPHADCFLVGTSLRGAGGFIDAERLQALQRRMGVVRGRVGNGPPGGSGSSGSTKQAAESTHSARSPLGS